MNLKPRQQESGGRQPAVGVKAVSLIVGLFIVAFGGVAFGAQTAVTTPDVTLLRQQVEQLRVENARLKEENVTLRRLTGSAAAQQAAQDGGPVSVISAQTVTTNSLPIHVTSTNTPSAQAEPAYWLTTMTNKRHNKSCRYFKVQKGKFCKPDEGVACRLCGG